MEIITIDDRTIRVDDDAPAPLPEIAHWLKDTNPPKEEIEVLLSGIGCVASIIGDAADCVAGVLAFVIRLLVYYCDGYRIAPTKYVSAHGRGVGIGSASMSISS